MKKILFLDFDGVITTLKSRWCLCPKKLELLRQVVDNEDVYIVISSSWRKDNIENTIKSLIDKENPYCNGIEFPFCDKIIGVTKRILSNRMSERPIRGEEIKLWLRDNINNEPYRYCILDDDIDILDEQLPYFVNTNWEEGLLVEDVEKVKIILDIK